MASKKRKAGIADIKISKEQQQELVKLSRAANRRLERASAGQRRSLEYNLSQYHTTSGSRGLVFQQGKAKSATEYRQRMAELRAFMAGKTSTRKGWESLKKSNLEKAQSTIEKMGYDVSDDELETILKEVGGSSRMFYKALENVTAAKEEADGEDLTPAQIREAINQRRSDYQATLAAIKARNK